MNTSDFSPQYLPDPGLEAVVDMALQLGLPLLVTGEPGTGKTQLAHYIARQKLQQGHGARIFNTKTSARSRDLFYDYDALRHFRDAGRGDGADLNTMDYITFQALGKAIIDAANERPVVLIDEIDKAPRDFPNDVLFEFEHMAFRIYEATVPEVHAWAKQHATELNIDPEGFVRLKNRENKPVLILTSNSEKNLS